MRKRPGRKVRAPEGSAAGNSQPVCREAHEDQSYRDESLTGNGAGVKRAISARSNAM